MISSRNAICTAARVFFRGIWRGLQYRSSVWFNESPATESEDKGSRRTPVSELSLARGFVARSSSLHRQINFWSLTGKGIDAELGGFKLVLHASVHRAEWNSAVHHTTEYIYQQSFFQRDLSKTIHFPCPESIIIHKARCKYSESRGWASIGA